MKLLKEFREFAVKGNAFDLAIGVIIGGAFGKIVTSLVADVIMPPLGLLIGGINFAELKIQLQGGTTMNIGLFLQALVDFIIISFTIFFTIKVMSRAKKRLIKEDAAQQEAPQKSKEILILEEIRDLLKNKS